MVPVGSRDVFNRVRGTFQGIVVSRESPFFNIRNLLSDRQKRVAIPIQFGFGFAFRGSIIIVPATGHEMVGA